MSSKEPWFPFYAADWLTDTLGMSQFSKGMYIDLLSYQWINGSIPTDDNQLCRIAGCDHMSEFNDHWHYISPKFEELEGGQMVNRRLVKVRQQQDRFIEQKRQAGRASGAARRKKGNGSSDIEQVFDSVADPFPTKGERKRTSQSQSQIKDPPPAARAPPQKRKTRLPEDWHPDEKLLAWAQKNVPKVNIGSETEIFRDYFLGSGGTKLDWRRTWQTWMRKEAKQSHKVKHKLTFEQAQRICIREHKTERPGESRDEFIDRMQMLADGFK
jgi:uncharacterized protein YdaU (DUF1376 family)